MTSEFINEEIIDGELSLVPYYPAYDITLPWYQNRQLVKQCDNNDDRIYDLELLKSMYNYLSENGRCYYISLEGRPVGDITLKNDGEICIVVSHEYQNRHLGRRAIGKLIEVAARVGIEEVYAEIYDFNTQSQAAFRSIGFKHAEDGTYRRSTK